VEELSDLEIVAVYSSDLKRAFHTAVPIAEDHGLKVQIDPAFREIDQGLWEGLPVDEIALRWPDLWGRARHFSSRPGGESPRQVRRRALQGLRRIVEEHPEGTVVVVTHGGTIRWLSAEALGLDDRESARLRGIANGAIVSLSAGLQEGRLVLGDVRRADGRAPDPNDPNN
jgi:alpha-ribazole phosphatase